MLFNHIKMFGGFWNSTYIPKTLSYTSITERDLIIMSLILKSKFKIVTSNSKFKFSMFIPTFVDFFLVIGHVLKYVKMEPIKYQIFTNCTIYQKEKKKGDGNVLRLLMNFFFYKIH